MARLNRLPLWLLALLSFLGYLGFHYWFPLRPAYRQYPLSDIRTFSPSLPAGFAYALLLTLLFGLYWLACQRVAELPPAGSQRQLTRRLGLILLLAALYSLPLLDTYPINATDLFRYYIQGRISEVYHQNPLTVPPSSFPDDPYTILAGEWINDTSPYGPVWELAAAGVSRLSNQHLYTGIVLFKALGAGLLLLSGGLLWLLLKEQPPAGRLWRTALWSWNPALLLIFVVDGHNDILMLFWLLLGYWAWQRANRPTLGFWLMCLAPLTKLIGLLPLPFFFLQMWREQRPGRARWQFLLLAAGGALLLAWLVFLPFGSPLVLVQRLAKEAAANGGFSPVTLFVLLTLHMEWSPEVRGIINSGTLLFGLLAIWLLWQTWRARPAVRAAADIFAGYLATAFTFRVWYTAWPFPWLLLDTAGSDPRRLPAGWWFLFTGQLSVIIYGHLHHYWLLKDHLLSHLVGVPFTFGLPLLLAYVTAHHFRPPPSPPQPPNSATI